MKILIRGAGYKNKGAEAMLRVVQRELSMRIPEASFYATVKPLEVPLAYRSGLLPLIYAPSTRMEFLRSVPFAAKVPEFLISKKNSDFAKAIKVNTKAAYEIKAIGSVDAVIDVSGFAYSDDWGPRPLKTTLAWVEYCDSKRKPYIFLPQAWGSFEGDEVARWAKRICNTNALVISRDDESSKHLAKLQGVSVLEVRNAPDIAFRFQGGPSVVGSTILRTLGIEPGGRPLIGLVPNMRVYERTPGIGAANQYVRLLIGLANYCIETLGASLLLAPNEISVPGVASEDDRFLCGVIESHIQRPEHCVTIRDYYPSETVKSLLGQVNLLIASRYHSLVFALSQGVPVMALGWSHKYLELLRPFELENYVVNHDQLDTDAVIALLENAWQQREVSRQRILKTVPQLQAKVDALFDDVAAMIREANR